MSGITWAVMIARQSDSLLFFIDHSSRVGTWSPSKIGVNAPSDGRELAKG